MTLNKELTKEKTMTVSHHWIRTSAKFPTSQINDVFNTIAMMRGLLKLY